MAPGDFDTFFVARDVSVACTAGDRIVAQMARAWLITSYCRRFESCQSDDQVAVVDVLWRADYV